MILCVEHVKVLWGFDDDNLAKKISNIINQEVSLKQSIKVPLWRTKKSQINQTKGTKVAKLWKLARSYA